MTLFNLPETVLRILILISPFVLMVGLFLLIAFPFLLCCRGAPRPMFAWGFLTFLLIEGCLICAGHPWVWDLSPAVGMAMGVTSVGCFVEVFVRRLRHHRITGLCALAITGCFFLFVACMSVVANLYGQ
jgi:hypothetical protein